MFITLTQFGDGNEMIKVNIDKIHSIRDIGDGSVLHLGGSNLFMVKESMASIEDAIRKAMLLRAP
jgi:hypothetical protein